MTDQQKIVIAIDGYSSCGKSTMARQLAAALSYTFIDSGAMYRAVTLYFLQHHIDTADQDAVQSALADIHLSFTWDESLQQAAVQLNGVNVAGEIRDMAVASKVSEVAAIAAVRHFAVVQQQQMGQQKGIVMDGRDIGTVVFPDAALKIFVTADTEIRVQRRYAELQAQHKAVSIDEVRHNLLERDRIDTTRKESPLRRAADALLLDNSHLNREEQLAIVLGWAEERIRLAQ